MNALIHEKMIKWSNVVEHIPTFVYYSKYKIAKLLFKTQSLTSLALHYYRITIIICIIIKIITTNLEA